MAKLVIGNDKTTGVPAVYREVNKNKAGMVVDNFVGSITSGTLTEPTVSSITMSGVTVINTKALAYRFYGATFETNATFSAPDVTEIKQSGMASTFDVFTWGGGLVSISMPNLETIGVDGCSSMCNAMSTLTSFDLSNLETVGEGGLYSAFSETAITSANLSKVETCGERALSGTFSDCAGLASVNLSALKSAGTRCFRSAFKNCALLTSISFPALETVGTECFGYSKSTLAFSGSGITEIHFPAAIQVTVEALYGYSSKFGATDATIYFDL